MTEQASLFDCPVCGKPIPKDETYVSGNTRLCSFICLMMKEHPIASIYDRNYPKETRL